MSRADPTSKKENNPEVIIENILGEMEIRFEKGDLGELVSNAPNKKRTIDLIIHDKREPKIIIECTHQVTISSGQGDKSKKEISIDSLIKQHYPKAHFLGFIDVLVGV